MTEHDRGAYTPSSDAPLAFDPRAPRTRRPAPMMLVASFAVLVVLVAALFMAFRRGALAPNAPARPVGAPVATIKSAPSGSPAAVDTARSVDVYAAQNVPETAPHFAAEPEVPQPRAAPPQLQVRPVAPVAVRIEPAATVQPSRPATLAGSTVIRPGAADREARPAHLASAEARLAGAEHGAAEISTPVAARSTSPVTGSAAAASVTGGSGVQIGAYSSRDLAERGYADVGALMGERMAGKGKSVTAVEKDGKTLFRTVITGFADHAGARAFCASLTAMGAHCIVKG